jgi:hypothetical protein
MMLLALAWFPPAAVGAQPPVTPDRTTNVEVDPIRCWWRTSAAAVRIGEPFSIILTCAVLEADDVKAVPDQSALDGAAIQIAPFEIVASAHPSDLRSGLRRFFQYDYTVRVISPDVIGKDVPLPELVIHYRVDSRLRGNAALQGRDLTYRLPAHFVRVVSTVHDSAIDIRDMPDERFGRIEALLYRAGVLEIVAITLMGFAGLMAALAIAGLVRRRAGHIARAEDRTIGEAVVLALAERELGSVQRESEQHGWSDPLLSRALAALRVVAASALRRPVSQRPAEAGGQAGDGRLILQRFGRRGKAMAVFSVITSEDVARELNRLPPTAPSADRQLLESLHAELTTMAAAQYGQQQEMNHESLDAALASAVALARRLKTERSWSSQYFRRLTGRASQQERQA